MSLQFELMNSDWQHTKVLLDNNLKIICLFVSFQNNPFFQCLLFCNKQYFNYSVETLIRIPCLYLDEPTCGAFVFPPSLQSQTGSSVDAVFSLSGFWFTELPVRSTSSFSSVRSFLLSVGWLLKSTLSWWAGAEDRVNSCTRLWWDREEMLSSCRITALLLLLLLLKSAVTQAQSGDDEIGEKMI